MVDEAYAECLRIARAHYENFPVASAFVPTRLRPHVAAIYAFARGADDIADEPGLTAGQRLVQLDRWSAELRGTPHSHVFIALQDTRAKFNLPLEPFEDLLSAFRQDVTTSYYQTWEEVFGYCRQSANPIGRLILRLAGHQHAEADRWSDAVCTALQLTNFWQDLAIDWKRGRLYVPAELWQSHGADLTDLHRESLSGAWRETLREATRVTRGLFDEGRPVCDVLRGRLRHELRATWLGGVRILDRLEAIDFDVFGHRPKLAATDLMVIGWGLLRWRR